jgi:anti-sigma factor RsiW
MNHPTDDELLLLAYGELPEAAAVTVHSHIAGCRTCHTRLARLEAARVALDVTMPRRPQVRARWAILALAVAAVLAGVVITQSGPSREPTERWTPTITWSATAGYVAGGRAMVEIDAQLTRLERERYYGLPN